MLIEFPHLDIFVHKCRTHLFPCISLCWPHSYDQSMKLNPTFPGAVPLHQPLHLSPRPVLYVHLQILATFSKPAFLLVLAMLMHSTKCGNISSTQGNVQHFKYQGNFQNWHSRYCQMWQHLEYLTEDLLQKSEAKERVNCHIPPFVRYLEAATTQRTKNHGQKKLGAKTREQRKDELVSIGRASPYRLSQGCHKVATMAL